MTVETIDRCDQTTLEGMLADYMPLPKLRQFLEPIATWASLRGALRKEVVNPIRIGCYTLFSPTQVRTLLKHFAK